MNALSSPPAYHLARSKPSRGGPMSPTRRGSGWRDAVGVAVVGWRCGAAHLAAQPTAGRPPSVLTAVVGPRQGTWTRSFNPFRSDAESTLADLGRHLRAAAHQQPRDGGVHSLAGLRLLMERGQPDLPRHHAAGRALVGRPALHGAGRGLHVRPDAPPSRARSRRGVAVPRKRDRAGRADRRVQAQAPVHAGRGLPRRAGHRARAQVEGHRPARHLRRSVAPWPPDRSWPW